VYVRKEIVHNRHVVETLRTQGAIFVDELDEVPDGATVIFSAYGISPEVREEARRRGLRAIDATCPLVTKVHLEAIRYAREDYSIVLIGHEDHDEVIGTLGEAPDRIFVIASADEVERLEVPNRDKIAYLTQTTLSMDDTREVIDALRRKFPKIVGPSRDDICYATQNRQAAVKKLAGDVDVMLVIGATNSSNANRLVEVSQTAGTRAYLIDDVRDIRHEWLAGARRIGVTAGASTPEVLVADTVKALQRDGVTVREVHVVEEDVRFALPQELEHLARERTITPPSRTAMRRSL
jgi:4-hydroxy-3-methylbut-2-enyl diphosphate reductase